MRGVKSIRLQLVGIMLICYLAPTALLGWFMGSVFFRDLQEKTETALTSSADNAYTLALKNVERAVTLAKDATYDGELASVFSAHQSGGLSDAEFLRLSRSYIERKYSREGLFTFALYLPVEYPSLLVYNLAGYTETMAYIRGAKETVAALGEELDTKCLFIQAGDRVYLVRNLMDLKMERFGMLVLGVKWDKMLSPVLSLADTWDGQVQTVLGQAGDTNLDWPELPSGLSELPKEDRLAYVTWQNGKDYDFGLRLSVDMDRIYGEIRAFRRLLSGMVLLLVPIMGILHWYVHRRITRPISLLSQASRRIESGELGVTVPMRGGDELGDLGIAFSNMSTRIAELIDKTYKEEIALRDAKIQAMQSRINPHFINNALETVNWEARLEGSEKISAMVESLSVLLNAGMGRGNRRMVPVSEEIEVARAYCYFIGLRFGERLRVDFQVDENAVQAVIPLLTLQPLLENAVEHGIEPAGGGDILLRCRMDKGLVRIDVINSGRPIRPEDQARIDAAIQGDTQGGEHLGLANICKRLHLIYDGQATVDISSDELGRTAVRLTIPARQAREDQEEA